MQLSIIIPCYNSCPEFIENLLISINSFMCENDVEAETIIVDDCSADLSYNAVVEKCILKYGIQVVMCRTERASPWHGPGAARQKGLESAHGRWVCFIDHDDEIIPEGFSRALAFIREKELEGKAPKLVYTGFEITDGDGKVMRKICGPHSWHHGVFYNRTELLEPYGIRFIEGMSSHEDTCFSSQVACIMNAIRAQPEILPEVSYRWYLREESTSSKMYPEELDGKIYQVPYIFRYFYDYLNATFCIYAEYDRQGIIPHIYAMERCTSVLAYCYFYIQYMLSEFPGEMVTKNYDMVKKIYAAFREQFADLNANPDTVYSWLETGHAYKYSMAEESTRVATGTYIPQETVKCFLSNISRQ